MGNPLITISLILPPGAPHFTFGFRCSPKGSLVFASPVFFASCVHAGVMCSFPIHNTFFPPFSLFIPFANISFCCTLLIGVLLLIKLAFLPVAFSEVTRNSVGCVFWIQQYACLSKYHSFQPSRCFMRDSSSWSRWLPTELFCFMKLFCRAGSCDCLGGLSQPHHCKLAKTCHRHFSGPLQFIFPLTLLIPGSGKIGRIWCSKAKIKVCLGLLGGGDVSVWQLFTQCVLVLAARASMQVRIRLTGGFVEWGQKSNSLQFSPVSLWCLLCVFCWNTSGCSGHCWKSLVLIKNSGFEGFITHCVNLENAETWQMLKQFQDPSMQALHLSPAAGDDIS